MPKRKEGILISFEGGEGGGKTTQLKALAENLQQKGLDVVVVREPGGSQIAEQIREVVLKPSAKNLSFTTEVFLFQAQRAQVYEEVILPALKKGKLVLCDRSRDSSVVYQGVVKGFGKEKIELLNDISTLHTYPEITFLLDVPVQTGLKRRLETGEVNRFDLERKTFHEKIRQAYLDLAKTNDHNRWIIIDASKSFETVQSEIIKNLEERHIICCNFCINCTCSE